MWQQTNFGAVNPNNPVALNTANPTGDGIPNLMKYAVGLNPSVHVNGAFLSTAQTGGTATLTFNRVRNATDITYHVEATSNLTAWSEIWNSSSVPYAGGTNAVASVTVPDNIQISATPGKRRFLRLKITQP